MIRFFPLVAQTARLLVVLSFSRSFSALHIPSPFFSFRYTFTYISISCWSSVSLSLLLSLFISSLHTQTNSTGITRTYLQTYKIHYDSLAIWMRPRNNQQQQISLLSWIEIGLKDVRKIRVETREYIKRRKTIYDSKQIVGLFRIHAVLTITMKNRGILLKWVEARQILCIQ